MSESQRNNHIEQRLSSVLREARPEPDLAPRFQEGVWHRIETTELVSIRAVSWLNQFVSRLLRPRIAVAGAIAVLLVGGAFGVITGAADARNRAIKWRER